MGLPYRSRACYNLTMRDGNARVCGVMRQVHCPHRLNLAATVESGWMFLQQCLGDFLGSCGLVPIPVDKIVDWHDLSSIRLNKAVRGRFKNQAY